MFIATVNETNNGYFKFPNIKAILININIYFIVEFTYKLPTGEVQL